MATEQTAEAPKLDPETERFKQAKASFEAALKKTAAQQGMAEESAETAADAPAEVAAPEVAPAKPKTPKVKAAKPPTPKPVEAPKPDPLAAIHAQLAALTQRLESRQAPAPEPEAEDDDPLADVRAELTERFGAEEGSALVKALEAINAPAQKRLAQLEGVLREATRRGGIAVAKTNRQRLAESLPHLKANNEAWSVIEDRVAAISEREPNKYATLEDAYDGVAQALYGDLQSADDDESAEAEEEASRIAASSMTAPSRSNGDRPLTRLEAAKAVFNHLKKNPEDKAGAKRIARELGRNQKPE